MNLALTILFLWLGCALLYVAFHPLALETAAGGPQDVIHSIQSSLAKNDSAYTATSS